MRYEVRCSENCWEWKYNHAMRQTIFVVENAGTKFASIGLRVWSPKSKKERFLPWENIPNLRIFQQWRHYPHCGAKLEVVSIRNKKEDPV